MKKKGEKSNLTQKEANDLFSYGKFNLPVKLANIIKVVMICSFFTKLVPIAPFLGLLSLILQYHVDKYLLLRRTKKPVK